MELSIFNEYFAKRSRVAFRWIEISAPAKLLSYQRRSPLELINSSVEIEKLNYLQAQAAAAICKLILRLNT